MGMQTNMKKEIWIFALEPLDNRYTAQWLHEVPNQLEAAGAVTHTVLGKQRTESTTKGAFLNFLDTNHWKSSQLCDFVLAVEQGQVADDAVILFTDFWNPALIQVAYMRDLLDKNWSIHGIAHAGAYDPSDILGYKMRKSWPANFERALYYASDKTYFATSFHREMFLDNLGIGAMDSSRAVISGQPYAYLPTTLAQYDVSDKTDTVMWPHRYNDDKQPQIIEDLASDFDVFITQKHQLTKDEYYTKLAESKIVFSCSLHENLGMSMIEGTLVGCLPISPDRAAYSAIYHPEFLYPSEWTSSVKNYHKHRDELVAFIQERINNYDDYAELLPSQVKRLTQFINPDVMVAHMLGDIK
jgi:hypothetical protein